MSRTLDGQMTTFAPPHQEAPDAASAGLEERRRPALPSRVSLRQKLVVFFLAVLVVAWTLVLAQLAYRLLTRL
jgi:hypothetical protein